MKLHKNYLTFSLFLTLFCPVRPTDTQKEHHSYEICTQEHCLAQTVLIEEASIIVKNFVENLMPGHNFSFNQNLYVIDNTYKVLTPAQLANLTTLLSQVVNSAISGISEKIEEAQQHPITEQDAITLLHALEKSLVPGAVFTLNGATYTVVASH